VSTAIIGAGHIGETVARHLVAGGERVVLAASEPPETVAEQLGDLASAVTVSDAIGASDVVVFAVWFDVEKTLVDQNRAALAEKIVVDPSNPVAANDKGEFSRTLPDGVSAGSVIAALVPETAHFVKAFGTVSAPSLAEGAHRKPDRAVLFYATGDDTAQVAIERLISVAGFDPVKAGGVDAAIRIEMFGDLHDYGGLNGKLVNRDEARALVAAPAR
jgi:predicted dinucleotide-binding enzyme